MFKTWRRTASFLVIARTAMAAAGLTVAWHASPALADESQLDQWQSSADVYVWVPTIKGQLNFTVPTTGAAAGLTVTPNQYAPKLSSAFMFAGETHNRNWGLATDIIYMNLGISNAQVTNLTGPGGLVMIPVNTSMNVRFAATLWTVAATFNLARGQNWNAEALAGGRYAYLPMRVNWNLSGPLGLLNRSGNAYQSPSLWDAIVGVKGRVNLGSSWFVPYYADVGTGDAHLTWQGIGGIGYAAKHGQSLDLVYRNLYYDQGAGKPVNNLNLGGLALGYTFKL
jgi:hypothetical protein